MQLIKSKRQITNYQKTNTMISILKHLMHIIIGALVIMLVSCGDKRDYLAEAKSQLDDADYLSYTSTAYFPIPDTKLVDTTITKFEVAFDSKFQAGLNFIKSSDRSDLIFIDGQLTTVNHSNKVSRIYLNEHFKDEEQFNESVKNSINSRWSPLVFMQKEYKYKADTTVNSVAVRDYFEVELDTIFEGLKVYVENHVFIDDRAEVERFERRNYNDGSLSQKITIDFSDFRFKKQNNDLSYTAPKDYVTAYGQPKKLVSKKVGELAPEFSGVTMAGDSLQLTDFKGQKVLLNFSVITCGNCKAALDYINDEDFQLSDEIPIVYINPEDNEAKMKIYREDLEIPFPVITSAKTVGEAYGVSSYPRFFLVDEEGVIEKVEIGFSEDFLDEFRTTTE